jgi:hypothetical protein
MICSELCILGDSLYRDGLVYPVGLCGKSSPCGPSSLAVTFKNPSKTAGRLERMSNGLEDTLVSQSAGLESATHGSLERTMLNSLTIVVTPDASRIRCSSDQPQRSVHYCCLRSQKRLRPSRLGSCPFCRPSPASLMA